SWRLRSSTCRKLKPRRSRIRFRRIPTLSDCAFASMGRFQNSYIVTAHLGTCRQASTFTRECFRWSACVLQSGHQPVSRKTASTNVFRTRPPHRDALRPPCPFPPAKPGPPLPTHFAEFLPLAIFRCLIFPGRRGAQQPVSPTFPTIFIARFGILRSAR